MIQYLRQLKRLLKIYKEYKNYDLKIRPNFNIKKINLPIWIHIINDKYEFNLSFVFIPRKRFSSESAFEATCPYSSAFIDIRSNQFSGSWEFDAISSRFYEHKCQFILGKKYNLENINNIKIRFGRFKIESMDFYDG